MIVNYHYLDQSNNYAYHDNRRSEFQKIYAELLLAEPNIGGKLLDIGCGHGTNPTLEMLKHALGHVDGVDPFPVQSPHPLIRERWTCNLEDLQVPGASYDMAYSYNVVEHVKNIDSFLAKALDLIRPGGAYWSMSPNANHPFALTVRLLQIIRMKAIYSMAFSPQANNYPAYYKLCNDQKILAALDRGNLPVHQVDFYYFHCVQWDTFFPSRIRGLAKVIDKHLILNRPKLSNIFMFRLLRN